MICPFCSAPSPYVIDTRTSDKVTRRRRGCLYCNQRFTTYEHIAEGIEPTITVSRSYAAHTNHGITIQNIITIIREYTAEHGYPPTTREIGDAVGISSSSHICYYLKRARNMGLLVWEHHKSRTIRVREARQ